MSDKKGWGATVTGWFIERDEPAAPVETDLPDVSAQPPPVEDYTTPSPTQSVFKTSPPPPAGGQVDFAAVFQAAGVDQEEQQRVTRTTDLLRSLPAGTDTAVKKQIVEASLKAFGVADRKNHRGECRRDTGARWLHPQRRGGQRKADSGV